MVAIYPSRSIEREETLQFEEILAKNRVKRIYLDELREEADTSLGVGVVKLIMEAEETVGEKAKALIKQAKQQLVDEVIKRNFIDLLETIIVYKLPRKSREEIEAMFGLSELKQTKVYQEALEEGEQKAKLETIPRMIDFGLSLEAIAQLLDLPLEVIEQAAQKSKKESKEDWWALAYIILSKVFYGMM